MEIREDASLIAIIDAGKCLLEIHCVPQNWCFEEYAAIFVGGICPQCGILKKGKFLGNIWIGEVQKGGYIEFSGSRVSLLTEQGYEFKGALSDLYKEYHRQKGGSR